MKSIAVDMSSSQASFALLEDGVLQDEIYWVQERRGGGQLFDRLEETMRHWSLSWDEIGQFICGRGPGNYSGLRMSLTAIQCLALPGNAPVYCLNSGASVAGILFDRENPDRLVVVGNARRNQLWYGLFRNTELGAQLLDEWKLCGWDDLPRVLPSEDTRCVSSCFSELETQTVSSSIQRLNWMRSDIFPSAGKLGETAWRRRAAGLETEPAQPVYMHPPVDSNRNKAKEQRA
jgi:tRNA threonylcarbamoyladenosine biosynthesis protein TsaB